MSLVFVTRHGIRAPETTTLILCVAGRYPLVSLSSSGKCLYAGKTSRELVSHSRDYPFSNAWRASPLRREFAGIHRLGEVHFESAAKAWRGPLSERTRSRATGFLRIGAVFDRTA